MKDLKFLARQDCMGLHQDLKFLARQDCTGLHHVVCCDPSQNGFVQAIFGHKGHPLLGWSDEPNEEQTVKKGAGPSEPNEEHTGKGGWAEVILQPPPTRVAFWGFCDVVKVTTIHKIIQPNLVALVTYQI